MADNYVVKDATLTSQTFASKNVGTAPNVVNHPQHVMEGLFGGVPTAANMTITGAWDINLIASLPAGSATIGTVNLGSLSGAALASKQPAFSTAGAPSADVLTIQGATGMTPVKVDGSGFTQPVSGTVAITAAALPNPTGAPTAVAQTSGNASLTTISALTAPFNPTGNTTLAVTSSTGRVAFPSADTSVILQNLGNATCYVKFGTSSVNAATTDTPIQPGQALGFSTGGAADVAAITASSTTTLGITTGTGRPVFGIAVDFTATSTVTGSGVAGTPATGVLTIQGAPSMTAVKVDGSGGGFDVATTITRPANVTAYTAGDVLGGALDLGVLGPSAAAVMITSVQLEADIAAIPSGQTTWSLHLYSVTPPSGIADNGAWDLPSGDRASYLGQITLTTLVDQGSTLYMESNGINKQVRLSGTHLFGYLVTVGGFTPNANSEVYKVTVHTVSL